MNCDDVRNLLKQASEPTAEQYEALASHLDTCSKCQALADEDPFAGSPEWKRALLEVSEASTEDQLLGGPRSFARKVFDKVWPEVGARRGPTWSKPRPSNLGGPLSLLAGALRLLNSPSPSPYWRQDPQTGGLRAALAVLQGAFEFEDAKSAPAEVFLGSGEECYALSLSEVLSKLDLLDGFRDLTVLITTGTPARASLVLQPTDLRVTGNRHIEIQVQILDSSGRGILAPPLRVEPGKLNAMMNVQARLTCEPDEFEGTIEICVRETVNDNGD